MSDVAPSGRQIAGLHPKPDGRLPGTLKGELFMPHKYALVITLMAGVGFLPMLEAQAGEPPAYQVYAVRYATLSGFPVSARSRGLSETGSSTSR